MRTRFLATIGVIALLALAGAGLFGLMQVKEKLQITVQQAGAADPVREQVLLLAEDVRTLRTDLDALTGALEQSFQTLYEGLEAQAAGRDEGLQASLRATREEQARLSKRMGELVDPSPALTSLGQRLASLEGALAQALAAGAQNPVAPALLAEGGSQAAPVPSEAEVLEDEPIVEVTVSEPDRVESAVLEPEFREPETPAAGAKKGGFLSFKLPSKGFAFDEAQDWVLLEDLSRVGFDAKTTLHDFSAAATGVRGSFRTTLSDPDRDTQGEIVVAAARLDSQEGDRDKEMRKLLDAGSFPDLSYAIERFEALKVDEASGRIEGKVHGQMTIHGKTHPLAMAVRASLDSSKRLLIEGDAPLLLSDYDVEAPNKLGLIVMEDEVHVWIALRARSTGRAKNTSETKNGQ